ncbi:MAG: cation-transporting P-type ATPase [Patescibacteria group bacterium]|nr:cation-transporting P-type ATPase [Patescibacteria group bacterium]
MEKNSGLSQKEAEKRLKTGGLNEIKRQKIAGDWQLLLAQVKSPLIYVLLGAMVITGGLLKDLEDTIIIGMAVVFNTILGFFQERKANRALEVLAAVLTPKAKVKRNGQWQEIEARQIVAGDLVRLEMGSKVPADGRVVKADSLSCTEAVLTGESVAVEKEPRIRGVKSVKNSMGSSAFAEQKLIDKSRVFMGTVVASGIGEMMVEQTGSQTEFGKIAESLKETKEPATPLQRQLNQLAKILTWIVVVVALGVVGTGLSTGTDLKEIFPVAVALAVAAIPEGLAVALTVILAIGMQRILKQKALVRKLMAAETLGGVSVICCDKTGTLTEGKMRVVKVLTKERPLLRKAAAWCNDMRDPLEIAMNEWARRDSDMVSELHSYTRLDSLPFDHKYNYIATLHPSLLLVSGAPEEMLQRSILTKKEKEQYLKQFEREAGKGHRLVGFAYKQCHSATVLRKDIHGLRWLGVLVFEDPIREGVKEVLEQAKKAGIKIKMITGDYQATAEAVAKKLGIVKEDVYSRVKPEQKLAMVERLQAEGEVVAMTGDGVNDAPALQRADIGIVVNEASDVAKEAADMVLLDNNFGTILKAIAEGRLIRDNLKKVILYLLADSFAEIIIVVLSLIFRAPLAVTAGMILWINLVSDGFPNLALTMEPAEADLLLRKVDKRKNWLIDGEMSLLIGLISMVSALTAFTAYLYYWYHPGYGLEHARSVAFSLLGLNSLVYVWSARSLYLPVWKVKWSQNKWLVAAVLAGLGLQLAGLYSSFGQRLLGTVGINLAEWLVIGAGSLLMLVIVETVKYIYTIPRIRHSGIGEVY